MYFGKQCGYFFLKFNIPPPYDTVIPVLDIYLKEKKTYVFKKTCLQVFIVAIFTLAKIATEMSIP